MSPSHLVTPRRALLAAPLLLAARPSQAGPPLSWRGEPRQGALLVGRTGRGVRLILDGRPVRVSPEGEFAFGFGRDHSDESTLIFTRPDGRTETRRIAVEKRSWDVQHITGLPPAQVTPDEQALRRILSEREMLAAVRGIDSARTDFVHPLAWPTRGRISGVFGSQRVLNGQPRQPHYGFDIAAPTGTPVVAALPGRVKLSEEFFFFGQIIVLDHGHGVNTLYAHLSSREVELGQEVEQGERIAAVGATGRVTGPHLHFSLSWYHTWLDPQPLLPKE